jgi:uncharacterized iron-regulated membrane protein
VADSFFRRVWRWHFWAGLVACPVLLVVALTGALYTFREEIEDWQQADVRFVEPVGEPGVDVTGAPAARSMGGSPEPAKPEFQASRHRDSVVSRRVANGRPVAHRRARREWLYGYLRQRSPNPSSTDTEVEVSVFSVPHEVSK